MIDLRHLLLWTATAPACLVAASVPVHAAAQEPGLKIAVGDFGLGLGDVPRLDGLRLNVRDRALERARGLNLTLWSPHEESTGVVTGLALGAPLTGARRLRGIGAGAGVSVSEDLDGAALGLLGVGAGRHTHGLLLGGLGAGVGGDATGLLAGALGVGAGGTVRGLAVGGLGVGAGERMQGLALGGLGIGVGGDLKGLAGGGLGVGVGGNLDGLAVGGLGVGVGGRSRGLLVGGFGVGGGGRLEGAAFGGLGAGFLEARGLVLAPAYARINQDGSVTGVVVASVTHIRGVQRGLSIGLVNIADELHGLQLGLINIARNKESFRVLPLLNFHP